MEKSQIDPKYLRIIGDSPIDNAKFFNFEAYVEAINRIIVYPENSTPLSIVVNGRWGSGKTSLMKTLRKRLDKQIGQPEGRKIRTIWFNAWKYSDTDAMLASLIREIYDEIERNGKFFTKKGIFDRIKLWNLEVYERANRTQMITDLAKSLTLGLAPDFTKWQNEKKYEKNQPFFDSFKEYMRLILNFFVVQENDGIYDDTKGVLVIFIDDLDRCPPKSIANILESINLFFDQKGCIFVFGMDTNLIAKAVNSHYTNYQGTNYQGFSGEDYLKKMIQLQFDLPEIRKEDIKEFIESELTADESLRNYVDLILTGSDSNPRQIKQYINSLRFMMTLSNTIERLNIDEELLIKWSILNLLSENFVNAIKLNKRLLVRIQEYITLERDQFEAWDDPLFYHTAKEEEIAKRYDELDGYLKDERIRKVLRSGKKEFTEQNLSDYIFLSSLAPKEADYVGAVTIVAVGDQSYYFGEKIQLAGTNTASTKVYISITSQDANSQNRKLDQFSIETKDSDPNTFLQVNVKNDKTWEYTWDTSLVSSLMKEGTYTLYACEGPFTIDNLKNKAYGTVSIIIKKPFVSATTSQSTVAQGDRIYINGTAEGTPKPGIQIWIFGENAILHKTVPVNPDASFLLRLDRSETKKLDIGQYFVIVQHPMINNEFDIYLDDDGETVLSNYPKKGTRLFSIKGHHGMSDAYGADTIAKAINNPDIDDTYTKLQFLIEKPVIRFDPIHDIITGDKFLISAQTNLAVDDEVTIEITSPESDATEKFPEIKTMIQSVVMVTKGESGMNRISVDVDTKSFHSGKYMVTASARNLTAEDHTFFDITEK